MNRVFYRPGAHRVAYRILISILNVVRTFFGLDRVSGDENTNAIFRFFLQLGCLWWGIDSAISASFFDDRRTFIDLLLFDIPPHTVFSRIVMLIFCMVSGGYISAIMRKKKRGEYALQRALADQRVTENKLREHRDQFQTLFEKNNLPMLLVDPEHLYKFRLFF